MATKRIRRKVSRKVVRRTGVVVRRTGVVVRKKAASKGKAARIIDVTPPAPAKPR